MATEVPLTQGYTALIDDEDAERVLAFKWCVAIRRRKTTPDQYYAARGVGKKTTILLHRFIMNAPSTHQVDHKDANGLNCQRKNLRLATPSQNAQNRRHTRKNGLKGVYVSTDCRRAKPFLAQLMLNRKHHDLGRFKTAEEAARAYDAKARELFGEFARTNFEEAQ